MTAKTVIKRLYEIRRHFDAETAIEKAALLKALRNSRVTSARDVKRLHDALCFMRAFSESKRLHQQVSVLLHEFDHYVTALTKQERSRLVDSGIVGTPVFYPFSYEVASWISCNFPGSIVIDWPAVDDTSTLDQLLEQLLEHSETDYFDSGWISSQEWLSIVSSKHPGTGFDWIMTQLRERRPFAKLWAALYNACDLPLRCDLEDSRLSKSGNTFKAGKVFERRHEMQRHVSFAKREIARPIEKLTVASAGDGKRLINVAMSSLAVRHRETNHFDYANPNEVYLADVGRGIGIAVMGLLPEHRYPLECTMGYLILSSGVPVGYGGASIMYKQANTGINIFDEYRGAEAAWLWTQVMRVYHALTGCNRFIANPYQFGADNTEALKSGAFWFYYRLGYRPVLPEIRELATQAFRRVKFEKRHRTALPILRKLASCDMHLTLPGARAAELFDETWIESCSYLATRELARVDRPSRAQAARSLATGVAQDLGIRSIRSWSREERRAFERFAPIVATTRPASWQIENRRALVELIRAKGGDHEAEYARLLIAHPLFFTTLRNRCRKAV